MVRHRIEQSDAIKKKKKAKTTIGDDYGIKLPDEDQVHDGSRNDSSDGGASTGSMTAKRDKSPMDAMLKLKVML